MGMLKVLYRASSAVAMRLRALDNPVANAPNGSSDSTALPSSGKRPRQCPDTDTTDAR